MISGRGKTNGEAQTIRIEVDLEWEK